MPFPEIRRRPIVGLALSGGGARGLAHIGVLKVLDREGIPVDLLAGTSAGGVVAALRALGMSPGEMEERGFWLGRWRNLVQLVDRADSRMGLFSAQKVADLLHRHFGDKTFSDLDIPLALVAVDLETGEEVVLQEGLVLDGLRATTAYPGVFEPVRIGERLLVDGGVLNNLPCDVARSMGADVVIAVDIGVVMDDLPGFLESQRQHWFRPSLNLIFEALSRSVAIMRMHMRQAKLRACPPEILMCPDIPEGITPFRGFARSAECIAAGERAAESALPAIRQRLERWVRFK